MMATPEPQQESARSSVQISVNAKGQRQWACKVYAQDLSEASLEQAQRLAMKIEQTLAAEYGLPG
jgi:chemotaxis methyl-accepting protein methylase